MSQVWLRGPVCGVDNCRSRLYRLSAGRKFCQFGHIMEGNFEFDDDDGDQYTQTRRLNIQLTDTGFGSNASRTAEQVASAAAVKRLYGRQGKIHTLKCLQYVLKQVTPQVAELLYPQLPEQEMEKLKQELVVATKLLWMRCVSHSLQGRSLRLADVYSVVFLALRLINTYPVYADAMIAILKQNKVPYISASHLLPEHMLRLLSPATVGQLINSAMPVDDAFYNHVGKIAIMIDAQLWHLPVEYFYPNAFSVFCDLDLDAPSLLVVLHRIASRTPMAELRAVLKGLGPLGFPDGRYIGLIYLVVKLYFVGLPTVVDLEKWLPWLKTQGSALPCFSDRHHHMDIESILKLSDQQTEEYCDWVYGNLLGEKHKSDSDKASPMEARLYKIFAIGDQPARNEGESSTKKGPQPPFERVENTLDTSDVASVEKHLRRYFCIRFGVKSGSLDKLIELAEKHLMGVMQDDKLLYF